MFIKCNKDEGYCFGDTWWWTNKACQFVANQLAVNQKDVEDLFAFYGCYGYYHYCHHYYCYCLYYVFLNRLIKENEFDWLKKRETIYVHHFAPGSLLEWHLQTIISYD